MTRSKTSRDRKAWKSTLNRLMVLRDVNTLASLPMQSWMTQRHTTDRLQAIKLVLANQIPKSAYGPVPKKAKTEKSNTVAATVALQTLKRDDVKRYRALPDPFCRYCNRRKPCGC